MSVLIKGMEMPTNCADCPLNYDQMACAVTWTRWWSDSMVIMNFDSDKERMPNCPLIEVPTPHGRLIDADKFKADHSMKNDCAECEKKLQGSSRSCEYDRIYSKMDFCELIDNAATVIEAEE